MTAELPVKKPARKPSENKPHENRIRELCIQLKTETRPAHRSAIEREIYKNLHILTKNIAIKKYGKGSRIDIDDIVHSVATSAIMTVVLRDKEVHSWVHLIRKMTFDWANKWMKTNLYGRDKDNVSFSEPGEDGEDDDRGFGFYYHDMDTRVTSSYLSYVRGQVRKLADQINELQGPRGSIISHLALHHVLYGDHPLMILLPVAQRNRVRFYSYQFRQIISPVLNHNHFAKEFL